MKKSRSPRGILKHILVSRDTSRIDRLRELASQGDEISKVYVVLDDRWKNLFVQGFIIFKELSQKILPLFFFSVAKKSIRIPVLLQVGQTPWRFFIFTSQI